MTSSSRKNHYVLYTDKIYRRIQFNKTRLGKYISELNLSDKE